MSETFALKTKADAVFPPAFLRIKNEVRTLKLGRASCQMVRRCESTC